MPPLPDGTVRPVKVQQRASGGCWRTLDGLADFAVIQCGGSRQAAGCHTLTDLISMVPEHELAAVLVSATFATMYMSCWGMAVFVLNT